MGWLDFLTGSTPAGVASQTVASGISTIFTGVDNIIKDVHLSPESQIQYERFKAQTVVDLTTQASANMESARQMQVATRSKMPALLAIFYTLSFVALNAALIYLSFYMPNVNLSPFQAGLVGTIYGALAKEAMLASSFYLGSSQSSDDKNSVIATLSANQKG